MYRVCPTDEGWWRWIDKREKAQEETGGNNVLNPTQEWIDGGFKTVMGTDPTTEGF